LAHEALEEPGAEGVELAHALHVDRDVLGFACLADDGVHELFELARMRRGP
jgi:hypothetical protein